MNILVTGSSGNIGSQIVDHISKKTSCLGLDVIPGIHTKYVGDINNKSFLESVLPGFDLVIHCAAYHAPHVNTINEEEFERVNVHGIETLLNASMKYNIKKFIYTSTTSVYGCTTRKLDKAIWVNEDLEPNPQYNFMEYLQSKLDDQNRIMN